MESQSSITPEQFTNFLTEGAFVRWQNQWILFWDKKDIEAVGGGNAIINCHFFNVNPVAVNYQATCILDNKQFIRAIVQFLELDESHNDLNNFKDQLLSFSSILESQVNWGEVDYESFRKSFQIIKDNIFQNKIQKAVPFSELIGQIDKFIDQKDKIQFLMRLLETPEYLYPYGQWNSKNEGFIGLTPEVLFEIKEQTLFTMALAGTSSKDIAKENFINDPKEKNEHMMVVKDIQFQLDQSSLLSQIETGPTEVHELKFLNHLRTLIKGKINPKVNSESLLNLTQKLITLLHPTAALGIYPRNDFMIQFEQLPLQHNRRDFGAPWGVKLSDRVLCLVAIRRLEWNGQKLKINAGCGQVKESVLEKEFAEIQKKIQSVKDLFFKRMY